MAPSNIVELLQVFREYENDINVGSMLCFLALMENPGLTVSQATERLGMSKQSASRNLRNLTHRARPGKEGIDVAHVVPDENDYRVQCWYLNDRGHALADRVNGIISE